MSGIIDWTVFSPATLGSMVREIQGKFGDQYPNPGNQVACATFSFGLSAESELVERVGLEQAVKIIRPA